MRLLLAGTGSAVGKTTISTGIMGALSKKYNVQPFKVGPDYIDPSYHTLATGNVSKNLDSFFMEDYQIQNSFKRGLERSNSDMGIIEGVRGLYEGISPVGDVGNSASIAKSLDAPVILIMNARSLVKSAAAMVLGFKTLDPQVDIEGVILNNVKGKRHYLKAKESVEKLTNTRVLGGIPRRDDLEVKQRHLGLVPALEKEVISSNIKKWVKVVEEYIDLDGLIEIMKSKAKFKADFNKKPLWKVANKTPVKIGVALDEIFTFYYKDNLEALEDNAAKIVPFSPYKDEELPDVDGLYIGGGYPEVFKKELETNRKMLKSINNFHKDNHPIYAECGGLIYLSQSIDQCKMVNILPYSSQMTSKVQGLSYVIAEANQDNLVSSKGDIFRGHEFHYTKINTDNNTQFAFNIKRGRGIINSLDGIKLGNTLATYIHVHACSNPNFAYNFTKNISESD